MSDHYLAYALKFNDASTFEECYFTFIDCQLRIASVFKINETDVNIILPSKVTPEMVFTTEKRVLGEIQEKNPFFNWTSEITSYDTAEKVYHLALKNIFY